jgi:tRNA(Arg) A34 adenosine deaminase TadA
MTMDLQTQLRQWQGICTRFYKEKEFASDEEMISLAVEISAKNVLTGSGGPFACAIFERDTKTGKAKLFSCGANRVVPLSNATLHAEMLAIQFAQKKAKSFSLKEAAEGKQYVLCTSCEPCCMCLGATMWSGVSELICAAAKEDAEAVGFDEGPVFPESYKHLEEAGTRVKKGVMRSEGAAVLQQYGASGVIYNG